MAVRLDDEALRVPSDKLDAGTSWDLGVRLVGRVDLIVATRPAERTARDDDDRGVAWATGN